MSEHSHHAPTPEAGGPLDVVIIGGGAAGLAAALQLARSRRSVVVVDAGEPRNAPAAHMHSYLGHDGRPPSEFLAIGRDEVAGYGAEIVDDVVTSVAHHSHGSLFDVTLASGRTLVARRVLVTTGLVDQLPDIPGVAEQWGRGVLHCPYCHGWEVRDQSIVVIATGQLATHTALLFRQLSDRITLVVHDGAGPEDRDRDRLTARDIIIEDGPVKAVEAEDGPDNGDTVSGVRLADDRVLEADAVVVQPRAVPRARFLTELGVELTEAPMGVGEMVATDAMGATSVPGVYAAGNVADPGAQVLQATAQGSKVAGVINADLAVADADQAVAALPGDGPQDWDRRYRQEDQLFSGKVNGALVAEIDGATPGTVLDVGCGEGADAVWLARAGWEVTAVDISEVAVERARQMADDAGIDIDWICTDIVAEPPAGQFDLVSVHYPALLHADGDPAINVLLDAVAPGGTLLMVGHDFDAADHDHGHPSFDPATYVQPPDVVPHLTDGWTVEVDETRARVRPPGSTGPDIPDRVLRARRSG